MSYGLGLTGYGLCIRSHDLLVTSFVCWSLLWSNIITIERYIAVGYN